MSLSSDQSHVLLAAQAEHVLLATSIWNFRRLFHGAAPHDAAQQFADIQHQITRKIAEHFATEDNQVFPLMLAGQPGPAETKLIAELRREHGVLLAQAQHLNSLLQQVKSFAKCNGEPWSTLRLFLADMEKHVAKEDRLFAAFTSR